MSGIMQTVIGTWKSAGVPPPTPFDFIGPPQLVSATFNGTSQYLTVPGSANYALGTGDFTIEWWQYQTSVGSGGAFPRVFSVGTSPTASIAVSIEGGTFYFWEGSDGAPKFSSALTGYLNTWVQFAISRISGQTSVYKNGTQIGSTYADTNNINDSSSVLSIGRDMVASPSTYWPGYISNFRIIKGTGIYTGNFTTPTKPLTAVTNTVLLLSMGATPFIDTSTNTSSVTVTNVGTVVTNNLSPFPATWTDSVSGIVANVAVMPNATSTSNPKYDGRYGGGIIIAQTSQSYVDVPTTYNGLGGFTISMAAVLPVAQGDHYVPIFDGAVLDRVGQYINARNWVGDGLEVGGQATWGASNSTTNPAMGTLAWWDFVFNGQFVSAYKNGSVVTGLNNYNMGTGNANQGWKNPLRFSGDDSISANNTMWPGTLYRAKCQGGALTAAQVTVQFDAVRSQYGL
jgi:hypothetical protein